MNKIINLYTSSVPYTTLFGGCYGYYEGYKKNKIIINHIKEMPTYITFGIISGNISYYTVLGAFYPITFFYYLSMNLKKYNN